jgi:hypothetical protein
MPTYDGTSTVVGNNGNGYAKITFIGAWYHIVDTFSIFYGIIVITY